MTRQYTIGNEDEMAGFNNTDTAEVNYSVSFIFLLIFSGCLWLLVQIFDINVTEDILKCGLCKLQSIDSKSEMSSNGRSNNQNKSKRCCLRFNFRERMKVRRQLVAEIEQEEL